LVIDTAERSQAVVADLIFEGWKAKNEGKAFARLW